METNQNQNSARIGRYEIKQKTGNFHFNLKAGNGEIVGSGKSKSTPQDCRDDISHVQKYGHDINNYFLHESKDRQYYFTFVSPEDNDVKITSEMYTKPSARTAGIESVMNNSQTGKINIH